MQTLERQEIVACGTPVMVSANWSKKVSQIWEHAYGPVKAEAPQVIVPTGILSAISASSPRSESGSEGQLNFGL